MYIVAANELDEILCFTAISTTIDNLTDMKQHISLIMIFHIFYYNDACCILYDKWLHIIGK